MKDEVNYPAGQLHLCRLYGGSEVDMLFYVNQSIEPMAIHHGKVVVRSEGIMMENFRICSVSAHMDATSGLERLPSFGVVVEVRLEQSFDPTKAVLNMALQWAEVFGIKPADTFISRWLNDDTPMSAKQLLAIDSPAGYIETMDQELNRLISSVS